MKLSRVERDIIIKSEILEYLTHKSKNLYNYANFVVNSDSFNNFPVSKKCCRIR